MTRTTSAKVAGAAQLLYIAAGAANEFLMSRATGAEGMAAKLARISEHATDLRVSILLTLIECISAFVLAVALYGLTRDQDHELAMLALVCRVAEGVINSIGILGNLGLLWLTNARAELDAATTNALGAYLLMPGGPVGAVFFAVGNTIFSYLLLRGRMVPVWLAWLGVISSAGLVVGLPLRMAGFLTGPWIGVLWLPEFAFAFLLALWLLVKGVSSPRT
jgi:hypothetical protein